ncbi:ABC transporter permease [Paenibacillus thiaminolyticus]|uniref:ABC transporter permease n=1 Tax=Paenibacillus thiaminolyticus TaxID=49283 RepID=UPI001163F013|nr:ABC transporter permease [Paenibacillus thiaminolyticus]NGP60278.1 ABC transporter permease [Paenibacillus thiaminolyticus]WCR26081.1 ABC transporter permease [Paenibacillus thiaminolyticus]
MTYAWKRISAIVEKEWKDCFRNPVLLSMAVLPIIFAFLFRGREEVGVSILSMPLNTALTITGAFVLAMMVAEEKEKHTLRMLMLSPARPFEVLIGKSAIAAVMTAGAIIMTLLIADTPALPPLALIILLVPSIVMYLAIGMLIGLLSRTPMETSFIGMPLHLLFLMGPMFGSVLNLPAVDLMISYLPTEQLSLACSKLWNGGTLAGALPHAGIIVIWMAASLLLCYTAYRTKRYDA